MNLQKKSSCNIFKYIKIKIYNVNRKYINIYIYKVTQNNRVAKKPGILEKPGIWQLRLKNLEKSGVWEILKKKPGILNNYYMLISKTLIWHNSL